MGATDHLVMYLRSEVPFVVAAVVSTPRGSALAQAVQVSLDVPARSGVPGGLPMTGAFIGVIFAIGVLALFAGLMLRRIWRRGRPAQE